jgi:hypothetical protein
MVWTMALAQVISWGTLFYGFSLFVVPMEESLGWSPFQLAPGLTVTAAGG